MITGGAAILYPPIHRIMFQQGNQDNDQDLTIVAGGGGNSGILVTDSAIVVIDTKIGPDAEKLYNQAKAKAGAKKIIVVNTHYHNDHVKGNKYYKGSDIYIGSYDPGFLKENLDPDNMPNHFVKDSLILNLGNERVCLYNLGPAHTWKDMVVVLKNRKVLFTGDLVFNRINPFLVKKSGANVDTWIGTLDWMLNLPDLAMVVPGHGETGDRAIISQMKTYFLDMKAAAADSLKEETMKLKYREWTVFPGKTSPENSINYLRNP